MASVSKGYVEVRFQRVDAGIKVSVKTDPALEASCKSASGGHADTYSLSREYWPVQHDFRDSKLSCALFMVGSSKEGGATVTVSAVRSKQQLQNLAANVQAFLKDWYENTIKPVDITITLRVRDDRTVLDNP